MNYFEQLEDFLMQSNTLDLKTSHYLKEFLGLHVKVSFGQGNQSRVPWIAFLNDTDTVQDGIYPVYLYYKDKKLLILAYGVSETRTSKRTWNLVNSQSIEQYFFEHNLGKPERYGSSFVFKSYNVPQEINKETINQDLINLIEIYTKTPHSQQEELNPSYEFKYSNFIQASSKQGLIFNHKTIKRFMASLLTKPFVILSGLSGSGKTKLAQAFAMWLCKSEDQYCIVPVGADWTNREPLLGFSNALKDNEYVLPENGALKLIIAAKENPDKPYFLILDEMNLSHVERYFADFLSVMESKSTISLHSGDTAWNDVPAKINFPSNLFIIGTVNIDETTYMFSPKVLDRANVIEFRVTAEEMEKYLENTVPISLENLEGAGAHMAASFLAIAKDNTLKAVDSDNINEALISFFKELKKTGAEFGYRSASEILRFAAVVNKIEAGWNSTDIIDAAIMQKLLPKVHGSRRKLEPVLKTLGSLCLVEGQKIDDYIASKSAIDFTASDKIKYPISLEKILRMYDNLISNSFTSYAEA